MLHAVIERDAAVQAVKEQLELDYQQWRAVSAEAVQMAVVSVEEHELVWIVYWQSETFVRTRKTEDMLVGNGPYLVDRVNGGLHQIGVLSAHTGEWETDYRARIRGLPVRTETDDLHDALRTIAAARTNACHADTAPEAADALACGSHRVRERIAAGRCTRPPRGCRHQGTRGALQPRTRGEDHRGRHGNRNRSQPRGMTEKPAGITRYARTPAAARPGADRLPEHGPPGRARTARRPCLQRPAGDVHVLTGAGPADDQVVVGEGP
ncbi:YrhB domain-containing protein [Streptomyces shaanxiensis]